jgi:ComF family protein
VDDASLVLIDLIGDLLSPPRCAACDGVVSRLRAFCAACAATIERCEKGGDESQRVRTAGDRDAGAPRALAFGFYGGALAQAIRRLKYEDRPYLARPLGALLRGACRDARLRVDAVLPVPLHPRRLVARGYNQAALLAAHVAAQTGAALLTSTLVRVVNTSPQVEEPRDARAQNVDQAFAVAGATWVEGRTLALVDDVLTTGATLAAARGPLLAAGARDVVAVVLARTPSSALGNPLGLDAGSAEDVRVPKVWASSGCANVPMRANLRN